MDSFPVNCHNCFSHKRQFYVFLECKHFMCLSCCLCLADFQNLTIRCCYRNTKMSEELAAVMYKEVNDRKSHKQSQINDGKSMVKQLPNFNIEKLASNSTTNLKKEKSIEKQNSSTSTWQNLDQSKIVHTFKMIQENLLQDVIKQRQSRINHAVQTKLVQKDQWDFENKVKLEKNVPKLSESRHAECPTFKQISSEKREVQNPSSLKIEQTKQNYVCWKNFDNSKDRILAKLNYHQQKINSALREHYYF